MYNIRTFNSISNAIYESLTPDKYSISDSGENYDGIVVRSAKLHDIEFPSELKAIARAGAGVNNIPVDKCSEKGIVVFNTPGANANAVKEMVIGSLLLSTRNYLDSIKWVESLKGNGDAVPAMVEKGKGQFVGNEIKGKKLGVFGLGAIGALVANAAEKLGMTVYGYDPYISVKSAWNLSSTIISATEKQMVEECDYITYHIPLTPETKGKINKELIAGMKQGVVILNFSRAELVNTADMAEALEAGKVKQYFVDFPTDDMIGVKNAVCIPHLASGTEESEENCARMASAEIKEFLENGTIRNSVNFPECIVPSNSMTKITIIHKNVSNTISPITALFAAEHINIEDLSSSAKGDYAYMVLQTKAEVSEKIIEAVSAIANVIRVGVIKP